MGFPGYRCCIRGTFVVLRFVKSLVLDFQGFRNEPIGQRDVGRLRKGEEAAELKVALVFLEGLKGGLRVKGKAKHVMLANE
jgi:hypothetical protein